MKTAATLAATVLSAAVLAACSNSGGEPSSDSSTAFPTLPSSSVSSPAPSGGAPSTTAPESASPRPTVKVDMSFVDGLDVVTKDEWVTGINDATIKFQQDAGEKAVHVSSNQAGDGATAESTVVVNPDTSSAGMMTVTQADGTQRYMFIACSVTKCFTSPDSGQTWTDNGENVNSDPATAARENTDQTVTVLQEAGPVKFYAADGKYAAVVDSPDRQGIVSYTFKDGKYIIDIATNDGYTTHGVYEYSNPVELPDNLPK